MGMNSCITASMRLIARGNITCLHRVSLCGIPMVVWEVGEWTLLVRPDDISYVRFILEGYDGLGIVSTTDPVSARIVITYPLSRKTLLTRVIRALHSEGVIREA